MSDLQPDENVDTDAVPAIQEEGEETLSQEEEKQAVSLDDSSVSDTDIQSPIPVEDREVDDETEEDEADRGEGPSEEVTTTSVIEAVLFASDEAVTVTKLAHVVELTGKQIRNAIQELNDKYQHGGHAFRIEKIAGGYQMFTLPGYQSWLRKLVKVRSDSKLSPAALETLAVVAYKQPVIRADIEAIRGVASGEILRSLMVKGLVKIVGRADVIGRPMLYGTTKKFLEAFGLHSIKDLPTIEELKRPEESPDGSPSAELFLEEPE